MTTSNTATPAQNSGLAAAVVAGGLVAGVLDAAFAVVVDVVILRAYSLLGVLQWIASGLVGQGAFAGGLATAALGVGIHFVFAFFYAALYAVAARRFRVLVDRAVPAGIAYGALIWIFMDLIVLPHSGIPKVAFDPGVFAAFLVDHALFVGLPIALAVRRSIGP